MLQNCSQNAREEMVRLCKIILIIWTLLKLGTKAHLALVKHLGSIKHGKLRDQLRDYQFIKTESGLWSYYSIHNMTKKKEKTLFGLLRPRSWRQYASPKCDYLPISRVSYPTRPKYSWRKCQKGASKIWTQKHFLLVIREPKLIAGNHSLCIFQKQNIMIDT